MRRNTRRDREKHGEREDMAMYQEPAAQNRRQLEELLAQSGPGRGPAPVPAFCTALKPVAGGAPVLGMSSVMVSL